MVCGRLDIGWDEFRLYGDLDCDADVYLSDFARFQLCFAGSGSLPAPTCPSGAQPDLDGDGDVDLADHARGGFAFGELPHLPAELHRERVAGANTPASFVRSECSIL